MATTKTKSKGNLFNKAKKAAPAKATKADEKTRVKVKDSEFFANVKKLEMLQERMKADKAVADMLADQIKETGKELWSDVYNRTGKNPGSIMLESKVGLNTAQLMLILADNYIKINEDRATYLSEKFGEDVVTEKTTFAFDAEMVDKYGEVISEMIESSDDIDEDDKESIIKAVTSYSVAKGTIDKLKEFSDDVDMAIVDIVEEVKPIVSVKNVEVIKG